MSPNTFTGDIFEKGFRRIGGKGFKVRSVLLECLLERF